MNAVAETETRLIERLPPVRGRLSAGGLLSRVTWFRVGGPAEVLFKPADLDDLSLFLAERPSDVPVTVLGVGSNLLVRDGGVRGVVIRLGRAFAGIKVEGDTLVAGAGALDVNVAQAAFEAGLGGLEFLSGIPGTMGGALRMNAGAYGCELRDVLISAKAIDGAGVVHALSVEDMGFGYRRCGVPADWIFIEARLRGRADDKAEIARRMAEIKAAREGSQPVRSRTGGSTFRNPDGHKAWELIDHAGCRGLRVGDAEVSDKHCNFLINRGEATAADLEGLGEEVRRRVKADSGVELQWEIKRIGEPSPGKEAS